MLGAQHMRAVNRRRCPANFSSTQQPQAITRRTVLHMKRDTKSSITVTKVSSSDFDVSAYDEQRLALDEQARQAMAAQYQSDSQAEQQTPGSKAGAWKWAVRKAMWDYMEENNIARYPRPVHHRIPNFVDAERAAELFAQLPEVQAARCIKVNPDTPQKMVRHYVLSSGRTLLTPQPRLRTGFFSTLTKDDLPEPQALMEACTSAGVAKWGKPLGLDAQLKVDVIVVGSSCVARNGGRLGKGEGFAELEYGILRWMGAIDANTPVITTVHDCQLVDDDAIPPEKLLEHDVPVDIIVTPTQVIRTHTRTSKPPGILWHKLSPQKLGQIRVLRELKSRIERETGTVLPSGPPEELPPLAARGKPPGKRGRGRPNTARGQSS